MGSHRERQNGGGREVRFRGGSVLPAAELIARLEAGDFAEGAEISAADVLAGLAFAALGGDDDLGPALTRQAPRVPG